MSATIRRAFVDTSIGQIHVATCGPAAAPPVLLLHQTPRSWREWEAVLPRLGERWQAVAMDTPGMGDSVPLPGEASIEGWADVAAEVIDTLGVSPAHVVGHHTGGVIAVALAARHPHRVRSLVLSSTPFTSAEFRRARAERPPIDAVERSADGTHLAALWGRRQGFYPPDRADLLEAFVADALKVDDPEAGHRAVGAFRMEDVAAGISAPVLLVRATADPFAAPHADELAAVLPNARVVDIEGGMVPLPDQLPEELTRVIDDFLGGLDDRRRDRMLGVTRDR